MDLLHELNWPVPVWVALITTAGGIAIAYLRGRATGRTGLESDIAATMRMLLEEARTQHKEDNAQIRLLRDEIAAVKDQVEVLIGHVTTLEEELQKAGLRVPPRPELAPYFSP